jgi:ribonuclease-3
MKLKLAQVEKKIGHTFNDQDTLREALTHSSHSYEEQGRDGRDNEVLEFLGDSVIGLAAADFLQSSYPGMSEGELSKFKALVTSTACLASFAEKIKLDKALLLGRGEEKSGGRKKKTLLAGVFEAVVGAIYRDGGYEPARSFVKPFLEAALKKLKSQPCLINNYKSALQESLQKDDLPAPVYRTVAAAGPHHQRVFLVEVSCADGKTARAKGGSIKDAEQKAAQKALKGRLGRKMRSLPGEMFWLKKE